MRTIVSAATALLFAFPLAVNAQGWGGYGQPYPYARPYQAPYGYGYGSAYSNPYAPAYGNPYAGAYTPANLNGIWYRNGQPNDPTRVIQYGPTRALFINEHGTQAWGSIEGDRVWIPSWTWGEGWNTHQGLVGTVTPDRIIWPDGSFWSRNAM